jgi:hypothetical protein
MKENLSFKQEKRLLVAPTGRGLKQDTLPNGVTLRVGPSHLDQAEIVTIAVFGSVLGNSAPNKKTGAMIQIYYLRTDMPPQDAISQGLDQSICGDCPLSWARAKKGEARCYVLPFQAPYRVFEQWEAGKYPQLDALKPKQRQAVMAIFNTVPIRLGAYGDPSCDQETLQMLVENRWAGYTHQWRRYPHLKQWLMASIDSVDEYQEAKQLGFRTYRHTKEQAMLDNEIQCPHDTCGVECVSCLLCNGTRDRSGKDIVTWTI